MDKDTYGRLLGILDRVPVYRYGVKKRSKREIQEIMAEFEYDEDSIENISDDFCQGFGVAREIIMEMIKEENNL